MVKIKICGFTIAENARQAALAGVDAIGLNFYTKSPRHVNISSAREIVAALPPFVNKVGLFVNANPSLIDEVLCEVALDTLQFHGDESPSDCAQYEMPFIKAIRVSPEVDLIKTANEYSQASALLLDTYQPDVYGGSGKSFDWSLANIELDLPIILAGGLTPENVSVAINIAQPYAVDVSSGVESAKGLKDIDKIRAFISSVNS
ncbi:MAG: phosphoribosylanthranilate isomerase [Gammaproteobacteria bacterium]|jgi:phosphoribosylanthranilate isomerase|nr:phosphoribosylanthranilate isomerase [Gammaproteobacteria bacterium]MDP6974643.1 phosphoribosylanthranilate isomerase [Gammaproteobacteria bacterium]